MLDLFTLSGFIDPFLSLSDLIWLRWITTCQTSLYVILGHFVRARKKCRSGWQDISTCKIAYKKCVNFASTPFTTKVSLINYKRKVKSFLEKISGFDAEEALNTLKYFFDLLKLHTKFKIAGQYSYWFQHFGIDHNLGAFFSHTTFLVIWLQKYSQSSNEQWAIN